MARSKNHEVMHVSSLASIAILALLVGGCAGNQPNESSQNGNGVPNGSSPGGAAAAMVHNDVVLHQWGVEVLGMRTSADGYMLDFRYRVVDAVKAAPLLERRIKPYLVVEKSDVKMAVPVSSKIGALRQTTRNVQADRNYFVMFGNPGRHVQPGDRVKVVIGDFSTDTLVVM